ncbi:putative Gamma-secretase subunit PEN-2 [Hypsibius exemplaris]|uniref:Gamma-secretase subunit PEN-2 n=1 Tax=Hypsibius exemplaris TaxID=2072580 RepID=A0A1W0WLA3_HYPEX|nr:putative Gamma-secretase subunit PEN-2 [Hypsibius exemplaris]
MPRKSERMDLSRKTDVFKADLSRKYFLGGFALLPFLWLINVVWFFREAFCSGDVSANAEHKRIRGYVVKSLVGCVACTGALIAWIVVFQTHRVQWGPQADYMSFIIPVGIP